MEGEAGWYQSAWVRSVGASVAGDGWSVGAAALQRSAVHMQVGGREDDLVLPCL